MAAIVALCPSRGRPGAAFEVLDTFLRTAKNLSTELIFLVDRDDPTAAEYPEDYTKLVEPKGTMAGALAQGPAFAPDATVLGMIGDDNRFRTEGWDLRFGDYFGDNVGIAFADDGHQDEILAARGHRLPTSWWLSRAIVDRLGMTLPTLRHFWMDNYWLELGEGADVLRYFGDVLIEHLHPLWKTAPTDETYSRADRHAGHDRATFAAWRRGSGYRDDLAALRALVKGDRRVVLADWHHPGLFESLRILFEDRFGWELYAPIGLEWASAGYWRFTHEKWGAADYLLDPSARPVGRWSAAPVAEYPEHPRKLLTLAEADALRPDIVLASVAAHDHTFRKLADRYGARYVYQMGNAKQPPSRLADLILASVRTPRRARTIPYHQEFDRRLFDYAAPTPTNRPRVSSFMLRLETASCDYRWLADSPTVSWHGYGGVDPRASTYLSPMSSIAAAMREADFIWHDKRIGDGYGHVLHNAAALGRPLIGHASHYRAKLGEPYWKNLETAIDLDVVPPRVALKLVERIVADPAWLTEMGLEIRDVFEREVRFDEEAQEIYAALS